MVLFDVPLASYKKHKGVSMILTKLSDNFHTTVTFRWFSRFKR